MFICFIYCQCFTFLCVTSFHSHCHIDENIFSFLHLLLSLSLMNFLWAVNNKLLVNIRIANYYRVPTIWWFYRRLTSPPLVLCWKNCWKLWTFFYYHSPSNAIRSLKNGQCCFKRCNCHCLYFLVIMTVITCLDLFVTKCSGFSVGHGLGLCPNWIGETVTGTGPRYMTCTRSRTGVWVWSLIKAP